MALLRDVVLMALNSKWILFYSRIFIRYVDCMCVHFRIKRNVFKMGLNFIPMHKQSMWVQRRMSILYC